MTFLAIVLMNSCEVSAAQRKLGIVGPSYNTTGTWVTWVYVDGTYVDPLTYFSSPSYPEYHRFNYNSVISFDVIKNDEPVKDYPSKNRSINAQYS